MRLLDIEDEVMDEERKTLAGEAQELMNIFGAILRKRNKFLD